MIILKKKHELACVSESHAAPNNLEFKSNNFGCKALSHALSRTLRQTPQTLYKSVTRNLKIEKWEL